MSIYLRGTIHVCWSKGADLRIGVPAGNTLDLDLELDSFVGLLEAEMVVIFPMTTVFLPCADLRQRAEEFLAPVAESGSGQAVAWLILEYIGPRPTAITWISW
ncbi:MAG: hypothetical protein R3E96_16030 [Planctomycetota bacterium]